MRSSESHRPWAELRRPARSARRSARLVGVATLALAACGEGAAGVCALDIGHVYEAEADDLEMVLDHECSSGEVTGTLYYQDFPYDLIGMVEGDRFTFTATRELPSGGSDSFRTPSGMVIVSGGVIIRGIVNRTSSGSADVHFRAVIT